MWLLDGIHRKGVLQKMHIAMLYDNNKFKYSRIAAK